MKKSINVALIGADSNNIGFGSKAHIPAIQSLNEYNLYAICTTKNKSSNDLAKLYGAETSYSNIDHLLDDNNVDMINIAVRVRHHYDILWKAIQKRKMIYCEWPLCLNENEAKTISNLSKNYNYNEHIIGTQARFAPGFTFIKEMIEQETIGEILFVKAHHLLTRFPVRSNHWWSSMEEEHSGALGVATAHTLDAIQSIFGNIKSLCAVTQTLFPDDKYSDSKEKFKWTAKDYVNLTFKLNYNIEGSLVVSNLADKEIGFELSVYGTKGHVKLVTPYYISYSPPTIYLSKNGIEQKVQIPLKYIKIDNLSNKSPGYNIAHSLKNMYYSLKNKKLIHPNFHDGYLLHNLIAMIKKSSDEKQWINIQS